MYETYHQMGRASSLPLFIVRLSAALVSEWRRLDPLTIHGSIERVAA